MAALPFLEFNDKGAKVRNLQQRLKHLGFDPGIIDGEFGSDTEDAVKKFQRKQGLEVDGQVGPLTWAAIIAAEGGSTPSAKVTPFAAGLASVATGQWKKFHTHNEAETILCRQIKKYYDTLNLGFTSCTAQPWSAAFISWCVSQAGATSDEFLFSAAHSVFVNRAIRNADRNEGVFRGIPFNADPIRVGDILQNNRGGATHDFDFARKNTSYESHSAIVVKVALSGADSFALTVGGNEGDSIRHTTIALSSHGVVKKRTNSPFIAIVRHTD